MLPAFQLNKIIPVSPFIPVLPLDANAISLHLPSGPSGTTDRVGCGERERGKWGRRREEEELNVLVGLFFFFTRFF